MLLRTTMPILFAGLLAMPITARAEHRTLNDFAENYEEAVEDLDDAVRRSHVDDYTVRLVKTLERLADDLEDATERSQDPHRVHPRFQEIVSIHNRIHETLGAHPHLVHDQRLSRALANEEVAMQQLSSLFVIRGDHRAYAPAYQNDPRYGYPYPQYESRRPPSSQSRGLRFQITPRLSLQFGSGDYGWSVPRGGSYGWDVGRRSYGFDDDDYEDYVEELEERREEARERYEERLEDERERREEAWEDYRDRLEDAREDGFPGRGWGRGRGRGVKQRF